MGNETVRDIESPKATEIFERNRTYPYIGMATTITSYCNIVRPVAILETMLLRTLHRNSKFITLFFLHIRKSFTQGIIGATRKVTASERQRLLACTVSQKSRSLGPGGFQPLHSECGDRSIHYFKFTNGTDTGLISFSIRGPA